jgi:DNA-binding transcriptional LysR family regulator
MIWLGDPALAKEAVLPLAVLEPPCRFRDAALAALERSGRPYRIVLETPSLSALKAAVASDLAVTCRTDIVLDRSIEIGDALPELPAVAYVRHTRATPHPTVSKLAEVIRAAVQEF